MKKIIKSLTCAYIICCAIMSCHKEESLYTDSDSILKLNVNNSTTKGLYTENYFADATKIGITLTNNNGADYDLKELNNLKFVSSGTGETQKWIGEKEVLLSQNEATVYAYYPYSESVTDITMIPVEIDSQTDYMYGTPVSGINSSNPVANVTMQHALAAIRLNISRGSYSGIGKISKVTISSDAFATKGNLNSKTGTLSIADDAQRIIEKDYSEAQIGDEIDIMVLPRGMESHLVVLIEIDGTTFKTVTGNLTLSQGTIAKLDIIVDENYTELIQTKISQWTIDEKGAFVNQQDEFKNYLVATYNVNETTSNTDIGNPFSNISAMYVDNIETNTATSYLFATKGQHEVAFIPSSANNNTIAEEAFYLNTALTSINIPKNVTTIGRNAFLECSNLSSITMSEGVTTIGDYAFKSCTKLSSVTIPKSVTSIGKDAFASTTINCLNPAAPTLSFNDVFPCSCYWIVNVPTNATGYEVWSEHGAIIKYANSVPKIKHINGSLYSANEWTSALASNTVTNEQAVGVTVPDSRNENAYLCVIHPTAHQAKHKWSSNTSNYLIDIVGYPGEMQCSLTGQANTDAILAAVTAGTIEDAPAAQYCASITFADGKNGYLPAAGELRHIFAYATEINECLAACGGIVLPAFPIWTSHDNNVDIPKAWAITDNHYVDLYSKSNPLSVCVVTAF